MVSMNILEGLNRFTGAFTGSKPYFIHKGVTVFTITDTEQQDCDVTDVSVKSERLMKYP